MSEHCREVGNPEGHIRIKTYDPPPWAKSIILGERPDGSKVIYCSNKDIDIALLIDHNNINDNTPSS